MGYDLGMDDFKNADGATRTLESREPEPQKSVQKIALSAEQQAAGRYYAGGNWATLGLGYASSVLSFATTYQNDINFLKDN